MDPGEFLKRPERWASVLGWATLAGLEFGVIGPFGSYASHIFTRIAFWTVLFWVGSLVLWPSVVAGLAMGLRRGFPPLFSGVAVILIACVPLAALGALGTYMFWPARAAGMRGLEYYGLTIIVALPAMAALVWLELGRTGVIGRALGRVADGGRGEIAAPPAPLALPANDAGLPDHLLETALCLQMEDHHVRVHLHGRSELHHAAMRQVVEALDESRGLQVHRSWWVARHAVRGWHRDGRSAMLLLTNGLSVPVARNRLATIRAHGWLDGDESAPPRAGLG